MPVSIDLKTSSVEDKRPSPGQLTPSQLSLNYNENGPFLCCKDTNGDIQQISGVKIDEDAPATPVKGTGWLKPSTLALSVYDGAQWLSNANGAVFSVNGQTGHVTLIYSDVGAASAAQGVKADTALQPGDNVSELNNDANYITPSALTPYVEKTGDTMTGQLVLPGGGAAADAIQKQEVQSLITTDLAVETAARIAADNLRVLKAGDTMTGPLLLPNGSTEAAAALQKQEIETLIAAIGDYWNRSGGTLSPKTSTDSVEIGGTLPASPNISLDAAGSIDAVSNITAGGNPTNGAETGAMLRAAGTVRVCGGSPGSLNVQSYLRNTSTPTCQILAGGDASFAGTVTATVVPPSDARFKENIAPANPQLADVVALGGLLKNYDWNDQAPLNEELRAQRQLGLIAQEAELVCPHTVKTIKRTKQGAELTPEVVVPAVYKDVVDPDNEGCAIQELVTPEQVTPATYEELDDSYKGISQDVLIYKLLGAVTELKAELDALKGIAGS